MNRQKNLVTHSERILFLNTRQARSGFIRGRALPREYILTCRFLGCGVIDRTSTLNQGFDYTVLDTIPEPSDQFTFAELCDSIGDEIVSEAVSSNRKITVLWSGGIDSTTTLIALMKAAARQNQRDLIQVFLSAESVQEYPYFYWQWIHSKFPIKPISYPIYDFLDRKSLIVTGEHGDQLFGSYLLEPYVNTGASLLDYQDVLPRVISQRLGHSLYADRVMHYLEPQIAAAPVQILTLFECMWWLNFSLKWQIVTLRLPVLCREHARETYNSIRHFFRDRRFQAWCLANRSVLITPAWELYKFVAKQYILEFTGDLGYYLYKKKELSLQNVLVPQKGAHRNRFRIWMREDFQPVFNFFERRR